jgi:hypothetical protein
VALAPESHGVRCVDYPRKSADGIGKPPSPDRPDQLDSPAALDFIRAKKSDTTYFSGASLSGFYASVVRPGTVGAGDTIEILD